MSIMKFRDVGNSKTNSICNRTKEISAKGRCLSYVIIDTTNGVKPIAKYSAIVRTESTDKFTINSHDFICDNESFTSMQHFYNNIDGMSATIDDLELIIWMEDGSDIIFSQSEGLPDKLRLYNYNNIITIFDKNKSNNQKLFESTTDYKISIKGNEFEPNYYDSLKTLFQNLEIPGFNYYEKLNFPLDNISSPHSITIFSTDASDLEFNTNISELNFTTASEAGGDIFNTVLIDTRVTGFELLMPQSPIEGYKYTICDRYGTFETNPIDLIGAGYSINGLDTKILSTNNQIISFIMINGDWRTI